MKILPDSVEKLIQSFEKLPGIGPKTASRLTFYLLHVPQHELDSFSDAVKNVRLGTLTCSRCSNVSETDPCVICASPNRDESIICVVEQPIDVVSVEKTGKFDGVYHVLHGSINPLSNIGPDELTIDKLLTRVQSDKIKEIILATNPDMEGEATAMYIRREILRLNPPAGGQNSNLNGLKITRIAHGLPVGADIEYADEVTLGRAIEGRDEY